jgi:hypothetical protein
MKFTAQSLNLLKFWFLGILGLLFDIISWAIVRYKIRPGAETLPLHYNIFYGADAIGRGYELYTVPAIGLFILIVNAIFAGLIRKRDPFAATLMLASALVAEVLVLLAIFFLRSLIVS